MVLKELDLYYDDKKIGVAKIIEYYLILELKTYYCTSEIIKNVFQELKQNQVYNELKVLVKKKDKACTQIMRSSYFYNGEFEIKHELYDEYIVFFRKLSYLVVTEFLTMKNVKSMMHKKGFRPFIEGKDDYPDFFHIDGMASYNKNYFTVNSLLKNMLGDNNQITYKDRLHSSLLKVRGAKKYMLENYNIDLHGDKTRFKPLFNGKVWIIKPINSFAGVGNKLIRTFNEFKYYFKQVHKIKLPRKEKDKFVIQEYITNPMLFQGKKFHLRYHMLCYDNSFMSQNTFQVITAKENFRLSDFNNRDIHDSHYDGSLKNVYFPESFKLSKKKIKLIKDQIDDLSRKLVKIVNFDCYPESKYCYQIFGVDIMILDDFSVKLLEVNNKLGYKTGMDRDYNNGYSYNDTLFQKEINFVVDKVFPQNISVM